jgi:hypothetical protein
VELLNVQTGGTYSNNHAEVTSRTKSKARAAISSMPYSSQNRNFKITQNPVLLYHTTAFRFTADSTATFRKCQREYLNLTDELTGKQLYINNPLLSLMTLYPTQSMHLHEPRMTLTVWFLFHDTGISDCALPGFRRGVDQVFTLQGRYAIYP